MEKVKKIFLISAIILFIFAAYLISEHLFQGELMFHTDLARDFLLIEDIVDNKDITLIGPKAGGIPGMFFGPVWIYMHVPIYLIGGGNPVFISYFWVLLVLLSIIGVYYVSNKIFGQTSAIFAALIYSFQSVSFSTGFTQSFGSVVLMPWLLYFMYLFINKVTAKYLIISLLINGLVYQMQPAVGMITLPVTIFVTLACIIKSKKYKYLFYYLVLFIPFSTYIVFDVRHDFLQVRAFINHFTGPGISEEDKLTFPEYVSNRLDSYLGIIDNLKINVLSRVIFISIYLLLAYKIIRRQNFIGKTYYMLFFLYFLGFVVNSLIYKGIIIDYYFWAFLPVSIVAASGLIRIVPKGLIYPVLVLMLIISLNSALLYRQWWNTSFVGKQESSWKTNLSVAELIYDDAREDFGYYVYSPDEFGYSIKYAINYLQKSKNNNSNVCKKLSTTYLIYEPTPDFAKTDPKFWKTVRVSIGKNPDKTVKINNINIEKYILGPDEVNVPSDPNIVCDLHFR